jgi:excisionase family DNA binding protein
MEQEYLTPKEVAQRLRVKATTVRQWIATGALEAETIREGRRNRHRIKKATIETLEAPHQRNLNTIAS